MSQFASQPPDNINDILPIEEMNSEIAKDVWSAITSINQLVLVNEEEDYVEFIEGGFTSQVLGLSLKSIESLTKSEPKYLLEVVNTFRLDEYLTIPDSVYTNAGVEVD